MKAKDIQVGGKYQAKVNGKLTTVQVNDIREGTGPSRNGTSYDVTNLATGRKLTYRSPSKFRAMANGEVPTSTLAPAPTKSWERTDSNAPHLIIFARAGTGKTTTMVCGLQYMRGMTPKITPSPQQLTIWESMKLSASARTVCFVAFNKPIATELQSRVPAGCDAMTVHSLSFKSITRAYGRVAVESYRVQDIIAELEQKDIRDIRRDDPMFISAVEKLVAQCKQNLTGIDPCGNFIKPGDPDLDWNEALGQLAAHYDVDLNGNQGRVFEMVPRVLQRCMDVTRDRKIDFNDMIWLPVVLNLPLSQYDLLLVDEAQDLNRCQQAIVKRVGKRLILCGDPKQAIYGFAGADVESMPRMSEELTATDRGCVSLPLTVTRRCGKAIVAEAKKLVPDFEAHETNPEGAISDALYEGLSRGGDPLICTQCGEVVEQGHTCTNCGQCHYDPERKCDYTWLVENGDMVLCRVNAPLVSQCFRFLKAGRKANIQGRDVGQGLISTIKKMKADTVPELIEKLCNWHQQEQNKENVKRNPSEARLIALQDRFDCLLCFCEDQDTVNAVVSRIESVFTDDRHGTGIKLSSVHKAKGLEAERVFLLQPKGATIPHPMAKSAWQKEQEYNLLYVAITRAIRELVHVTGGSAAKQPTVGTGAMVVDAISGMMPKE